jgi:hypothetical protein
MCRERATTLYTDTGEQGIKWPTAVLSYQPATLVEEITNAKEVWDTLADKSRPQGENTISVSFD